MATSITWTRTLDPGRGLWTLDPDPGTWTRILKTWTLDSDPEKPGPRKTWTLKNLR